jgi:lysophospholipase
MAFILSSFQFLVLLILSFHIYAAPVPESKDVIYILVDKRATSAYAPYNSTCPSTPLVRAASSISSGESNYISARKPIATAALGTWLQKVNSSFSTSNLPSVGLTTSGGGLRSLLEGAGVVQAFDSRDSSVGTSGLYQGLVYQAGLSGGGWLLSSVAGNNWPTISSLKTGLWETAFQDSLLDPGGAAVGADDALIVNDIVAKNDAGFPITLTDPYGRLLSYQLLYGTDGGVADRLSGLTILSSFTSHSVPYPIITSIEVTPGQCIPADSNPQMEMHPYEWGSWDSGIAAFTQTAYLGSSLVDGNPAASGSCIQNYDNLGYILGTSSNLFSEACIAAPSTNSSDALIAALEAFLTKVDAGVFRDEFAVYPNPFYGYTGSPLVSGQTELYLVDGGLSNQNNPIWYVLSSFPT